MSTITGKAESQICYVVNIDGDLTFFYETGEEHCTALEQANDLASLEGGTVHRAIVRHVVTKAKLVSDFTGGDK